MIARRGVLGCALPFLAAALFLVSCDRNVPASPDALPPDFLLTYSFAAETVPPPWHQEYTITLAASGAGSLLYLPDYPGPDVPEWTDTFVVTPEGMASLWRAVKASGLLEGSLRTRGGNEPVGGATQMLSLRCGGHNHSVPSWCTDPDRAAVLFDAVTAIVPPATWKRMELGREGYQEEFQRKRGGQ